jgi:hypothetical protein
MADIFPGAPKPSLLNQELTLNDSELAEVQQTIDTESKNVTDQKRLQKIYKFNNTSYSGTDIKVLVHKYSAPSVDLKADIMRAMTAYSQIAELVTQLAVEIVPAIGAAAPDVKRGNLTELSYQILLEDYRQAINQINTLEGQVKDTGFMQFVGNSLSGRLADAQRNHVAVTAEFLQIASFIEKLRLGWAQQASAIGARSKDFIQTKVLAELQTLSVSSYREKVGVRACGNVGVLGYTRGPRTVAGSMIFTVFDRNVLFELLDVSSFDADDQFRAAIKDQLPPMDITITFANELGALSRMSIYGLEFVSEGQTMSIEDIILEDVCQWVARDYDPMTPVVNEQGEPYNQVLLNYNQAVAQGRGSSPMTDLRASDLRGSEWDVQPGSDNNGAIKRFRDRHNPFF